MRQFSLKLCLFLFLAACLSGRTSELGVLVGGVTGTVLLWPLYRRWVLTISFERVVKAIDHDDDPNLVPAGKHEPFRVKY